MKELFKIAGLAYCTEDFLDDINEYEDIIPIIKDFEDVLKYEELSCTEKNECCGISKNNYYVELYGYLNNEDEYITKEEAMQFNIPRNELTLFVIRIYKCKDCGKWIIDILED